MKSAVSFIDPGNKSSALIGQRDSVFVVNKSFKLELCVVCYGGMAAKIPCFFVFMD